MKQFVKRHIGTIMVLLFIGIVALTDDLSFGASYTSVHQMPSFNISTLTDVYGGKDQFHIGPRYQDRETFTFTFSVKHQYSPFMRVYIPPGTTSFQITMYFKKGTGIRTEVSLDAPPTGSGEFPLSVTCSLDDLTGGATRRSAAGGASGSLVPVRHYGETTKGHWLFLHTLNLTGGPLQEVRFSNTVRVAKFQLWYDAQAWLPNGDPDQGIKPQPDGYVDLSANLPGLIAGADQIQAICNKLAGASDEVFIESLYRNILGRQSDPGGMESWLKNMPDTPRRTIVAWFLTSAEFWLRY